MGLEEAHVAELRQLTAFWDEKQAESAKEPLSLSSFASPSVHQNYLHPLSHLSFAKT